MDFARSERLRVAMLNDRVSVHAIRRLADYLRVPVPSELEIETDWRVRRRVAQSIADASLKED